MRTQFNLNHNWEFCVPGMADTACSVTLPHTIGLTPAISSGGRNLLTEVQYERVLKLPESEKGKKIFLRFNGIMGKAKIFLNDQEVGISECSYIPAVVDLTDKFCFGRENFLRILADNRPDPDIPPGKPQDDLDFMYDGGIYRTASLTTVPRLYFTDPLLQDEVAGGGIFVWTKALTDAEGTVGIRAEIKNETGSAQNFDCRFTLLDSDGNKAASSAQAAALAPGQTTALEDAVTVPEPKTWSPEAPNLYQMVCEIVQDGEIIDTLKTTVGLRTFAFTCDRDLVWNGTSRRISGANYHSTFPYLGSAMPDNMLYRDARKLRNLGMKNIRSHYPFDESFLDACDQLGITLIVSNPGWQWFREGIFAERLVQNMRRIIRWQRNHPCIILWEPMPNESGIPEELKYRLHNTVHEEYPYAPCFTASDHEMTDVCYAISTPDTPSPDSKDFDMEKYRNLKLEYPLWVREYGDGPDDWTNQSGGWRTPRQWGDYAMVRAVNSFLGTSRSPYSDLKVAHYMDVYSKKHICGYGIWPGMEHNRGYHINPCWGGLLDLFRIPKFSAEFMNSQQDMEEIGPTVFIANWWTDTSPEDITVYSNADSVRLFCDDILIEERKPEPYPIAHPPFVFRDVAERFRPRERSTLRAQALVNGEVVAETARMAPGVPYSLRLEADTEGVPFRADAEDAILVRCYVTDREGNVVPRAADTHPILFTVSGGAEIVGNSDIGANPICPQAGIACVLLRSTGNPQPVHLTAQMYWPQSRSIEVRSDTITIQTV